MQNIHLMRKQFAVLIAGLLAIVLTSLFGLQAHAADGAMVRLPTREGVLQAFYWVKQDNAAATLVLMPGGIGVIGALDESGWPGSRNFLIRSGKLFAAQGLNVAMVDRPSDVPDLDGSIRTGAKHMHDLHVVLEYLKAQSDAPVWVVGTSMGTISAASIAIAESDSKLLDGIVLTSSITNYATAGAVPTQALEKIRVPVLVLHHEKDSCRVSRPFELSRILDGLKNAPIKKQIIVSGGVGARGNPCEALHYHGYIGMEQEVVGIITQWIRNPTN